MLRDVFVYLENGLFIKAKGAGRSGTLMGEVVFNTSLTGYQEIITDPSYAGQFILFCMPEIGIVGFNEQDCESDRVHAKGVIVRRMCDFYSNFRAREGMLSFLERNNILGICDIDTRGLVKILRDTGSMNIIASTDVSDKGVLREMLKDSLRAPVANYVGEVSTKHSYIHRGGVFDFDIWDYASDNSIDGKKRVLVIDFGVKRSILRELSSSGMTVEVSPHDFNASDIISRYSFGELGGVLLSNGPGDPLLLSEVVHEVRKLIEAKIPILGICLGHQLLSIAHGYDTYRLKFGQHGGNHPVKNALGNVEVTVQNHNYSVPESISDVALITHRSLFDNTVEGVKYKESPIFSLQYHPESSPGPRDSCGVFYDFFRIVSSTT